MINLSKRLQSCADLVRSGKRLADVGCDHGYVPVYLVENEKIPFAIACDVNEAPLLSCKNLVCDYGFENKIKCVLSNGLENVEENEADDVLIAGMGGELIAEILSNCAYINKKHLILNPMTHPELARKWLYENGFEIENDFVVSEGKHSYSVFDAYYTGENKDYTDLDLFLGKISDFSNKDYFIHLLNYLKNKEKGGADYSGLILKIEEKINDNG